MNGPCEVNSGDTAQEIMTRAKKPMAGEEEARRDRVSATWPEMGGASIGLFALAGNQGGPGRIAPYRERGWLAPASGFHGAPSRCGSRLASHSISHFLRSAHSQMVTTCQPRQRMESSLRRSRARLPMGKTQDLKTQDARQEASGADRLDCIERQPYCRLSFRIFEQPVLQIPSPVHDAFDPKGFAVHVEEQMTVEWFLHLDTANLSEFGGPEATAASQTWPFRDSLNGFMHGKQITFGDVEVGIIQIPAVLQGHVLLRPEGNGYFQAHAMERAL